MRRIITFIFAATLLWACNSTEYRISGTIDGANDGDSVVLGYSADGMEFTTVATSVITNGEFAFSGNQKGCKIYYIGYENADEPIYALFFLEPGEITAAISPNECTISGTPTNDLNNEVEKELFKYAQNIMDYQEALYVDSTLTEEETDEIGNKLYMAHRDAMTYIENVIRENIDNMLGMFLLVQYSDIFDNEDFTELVATVPDKNKDHENNPLFDILLAIQKARTDDETYSDIFDASDGTDDFDDEDEDDEFGLNDLIAPMEN